MTLKMDGGLFLEIVGNTPASCMILLIVVDQIAWDFSSVVLIDFGFFTLFFVHLELCLL